MSREAILCDTGALLSYLDAGSPDHRAYRDAIDAARARFIPGLVLAEVDYVLRADRGAMRVLLEDMRRRAFIQVAPTDGQLARAMEIDAHYETLGLGLVDATLIALAEELGVLRVATRDVRHFSVVRLFDGRSLDIVVVPDRTSRPRPRARRRR